jgi:hypothetical protein
VSHNTPSPAWVPPYQLSEANPYRYPSRYPGECDMGRGHALVEEGAEHFAIAIVVGLLIVVQRSHRVCELRELLGQPLAQRLSPHAAAARSANLPS